MVCHKFKKLDDPSVDFCAGFTLVEVVIAITLVGIVVASTVAALTRLNAFASASRNATGAFTVAMNQVDAIQSATPFNPQSGQVPSVLVLGTHAPDAVQIYQDSNNVVVPGTLTTTVANATSGGVTMYRATVTVNYTYLNRPYSLSMNTVRASDE